MNGRWCPYRYWCGRPRKRRQINNNIIIVYYIPLRPVWSKWLEIFCPFSNFHLTICTSNRIFLTYGSCVSRLETFLDAWGLVWWSRAFRLEYKETTANGGSEKSIWALVLRRMPALGTRSYQLGLWSMVLGSWPWLTEGSLKVCSSHSLPWWRSNEGAEVFPEIRLDRTFMWRTDHDQPWLFISYGRFHHSLHTIKQAVFYLATTVGNPKIKGLQQFFFFWNCFFTMAEQWSRHKACMEAVLLKCRGESEIPLSVCQLRIS